MTEVTQRSEFECAYIMYTDKYDDALMIKRPVPELNAHHYVVSVTVTSKTDRDIIIEFKQFKSIVDQALPDGRFLYNRREDPNSAALIIAEGFKKAGVLPYEYDFVISTENLVNHIAQTIQSLLKILRYEDVIVTKVVLKETADSATTWTLNS